MLIRECVSYTMYMFAHVQKKVWENVNGENIRAGGWVDREWSEEYRLAETFSFHCI